MKTGISKSIPRPDGKRKASGSALYINDHDYSEALTARFYRSDFTRGRITHTHIPEMPEGYWHINYKDVPPDGENKLALIKKDWPAFAEEEIRYKGQIIGIICGPDPNVVNRLVDEIKVDYIEKIPAVTLDDSLNLKGGPLVEDNNVFSEIHLLHGDSEKAFVRADSVVEGVYETGFQEQFYMEPQGLVAWMEAGKVHVHGSMQCPYYVKHAVEEILGPRYPVRAIEATIGGGFGGKEDYPEIMGAPLAVAALKTGKPLKMIFDRSEDMAWTSKRHPSRIKVRTAHDQKGKITAMDIDCMIDGGAYESYSLIVLMRAVFTSTGVYHLPAVNVRGRAMATCTVPSGAFRGFGAPQAIFALEMHMEKCARRYGKESLSYKTSYFLKKGDPTITGGKIRDNVVLDKMVNRIEELSDYSIKREKYGKIPWKGIGLSLFNHGCGFTGDGEQRIIKASAALHKNADGVVEILTAAVDFGQGPRTTFRKVVGTVLGIEPQHILFALPDTDKVPDSGPTVASRTIMIVGFLLQEAARELKEIWKEGEEQKVLKHYRMPPGLSWDQDTLQGDAYATFGWGVNVCEVEVDPLTWETRVIGAWGVYDVGVAIDEKVVNGQIQGGMSQALGYGAMENLTVDKEGVFRQKTMADYMVPTSLDFPRTGADTIDNPYDYGPFGAKGMGEMVHDGGHAAFASAVEQAIGRDCNKIPLIPETIREILKNEN
jgi:CO/xanthine dehydrogenase Mo-binding subunit